MLNGDILRENRSRCIPIEKFLVKYFIIWNFHTVYFDHNHPKSFL